MKHTNSSQTNADGLKINPHPEQHPLDGTDREILQLLQEDARISLSEVGRRVHLSQTAVAARVRALEDAGIIIGYHAKVNTYKLGYPIMAIILVKAATIREAEQVSAIAGAIPEILESHRITGDNGIVLKVIASSVARLDQIIHDISAASAPTTCLVLATHFEARPVPTHEAES
ncbi:MAG: Lrp/AsnC family transcriptional regulator [Anaerolineae bacterium]